MKTLPAAEARNHDPFTGKDHAINPNPFHELFMSRDNTRNFSHRLPPQVKQSCFLKPAQDTANTLCRQGLKIDRVEIVDLRMRRLIDGSSVAHQPAGFETGRARRIQFPFDVR